ncbi:Rieske (2Fe-2S) protein [Stratiformator vulcanicus]|uniref:3-phenylpropionate/cinnamic acid dioxygenase ferredoxin subunit n=1 Tax=Stratiformator vulcanicus TaxID=2527980 RepID=A0A517QZM0_9PLAN|nr:Rieske 2Fe-2S domain-containing protein [Stratiformator vulcanicus]QDT37092.1 3-phenylpropionate/cinnamic acid dioxygenase ferredoxin subunit [Stratiformator vulcanicus]
MAEFHSVAKVGDIPENEGRAYDVDGVMVAVFNLGGTFAAIDDMCPHAGASLSAGHVEEEVVMCPLHAWRFHCRTGKWMDNPTAKLGVETYETRVQDGEIQVSID